MNPDIILLSFAIFLFVYISIFYFQTLWESSEVWILFQEFKNECKYHGKNYLLAQTVNAGRICFFRGLIKKCYKNWPPLFFDSRFLFLSVYGWRFLANFTETKEHCTEIRIDDQILTNVVINPLNLHNQSLLVHLMLLQSFTSKLLNHLLIKMGLFTMPVPHVYWTI